jgi:hypothetical protein
LFKGLSVDFRDGVFSFGTPQGQELTALRARTVESKIPKNALFSYSKDGKVSAEQFNISATPQPSLANRVTIMGWITNGGQQEGLIAALKAKPGCAVITDSLTNGGALELFPMGSPPAVPGIDEEGEPIGHEIAAFVQGPAPGMGKQARRMAAGKDGEKQGPRNPAPPKKAGPVGGAPGGTGL